MRCSALFRTRKPADRPEFGRFRGFGDSQTPIKVTGISRKSGFTRLNFSTLGFASCHSETGPAAAHFLSTRRIQCKKRMVKVKISLSSTEVSEVASAVHVFRDTRKQPQPIA